ncbi:hypothetical protein ACA29_07295 [Lederbergia galactosidilytica]|uniref:Uncharacterized protein n=1 Tax=Lederbergia galactosidilytica TaxID=217031 RepID=A0A0Q9XZL2_9BACI|nr:hypothetical protein ACA29_07295 [Lederbergia galactosidilytica]
MVHIENEYSKIPYDYEGVEKVISINSDLENIIVVGCRSSKLAIRLNASEVFTIDHQSLNTMQQESPAEIKFTVRFGLQTLKRDSQFNKAIITDIWKVFPEDLLPTFFLHFLMKLYVFLQKHLS